MKFEYLENRDKIRNERFLKWQKEKEELEHKEKFINYGFYHDIVLKTLKKAKEKDLFYWNELSDEKETIHRKIKIIMSDDEYEQAPYILHVKNEGIYIEIILECDNSGKCETIEINPFEYQKHNTFNADLDNLFSCLDKRL